VLWLDKVTRKAKTATILGLTSLAAYGAWKVYRHIQQEKCVDGFEVVVNDHIDNYDGPLAEEMLGRMNSAVLQGEEETDWPSQTNTVGELEYDVGKLEVHTTMSVPAKLVQSYANRVLCETKCKVGLVPNDSLHRRIIYRTANNICLKHKVRPSQRMIVSNYVVKFYFFESELDQQVHEGLMAYHRHKFKIYRLITRMVTGRYPRPVTLTPQ
jgi:hypothetical protein